MQKILPKIITHFNLKQNFMLNMTIKNTAKVFSQSKLIPGYFDLVSIRIPSTYDLEKNTLFLG